MPAAIVIVLGLTIAGILAEFLVWRELDRVGQARGESVKVIKRISKWMGEEE